MWVSCRECYTAGPQITIAILSTPGRCRFLLAMGHFDRLRQKPRCDPNRNRRSGPLPPGEVRVRFRAGVVPLVSLFRKLEIGGVAIAENYIKAILAFVVVPLAPRIFFVAIRPPLPIALDQLIRRTQGDLARFYRGCLGGAFHLHGVGGHMLDAQRLHCPNREITIAPSVVT